MLTVPPLRERREDIPLLVDHIVAQVNERYGFNVRGVTARALRRLEQPPWRGNVRELEAVLDEAMIFRRAEWIGPDDLDFPFSQERDVVARVGMGERVDVSAAHKDLSWLQREALSILAERRKVRRADMVAQCRVSHEGLGIMMIAQNIATLLAGTDVFFQPPPPSCACGSSGVRGWA